MVLSPELNYSLNEFDGLNVLDLSGAITVISFDDLIATVHKLSESGSLIIDIKDIDFLTSSGINALIEISYYAKLRGNRIILMNTDADIIDLIDFVDCHSHFIFAEDFEEAKTKIEHYL